MARPLFEAKPDELENWCGDHGQPPYRARQVREWVVQRRATRFDLMSDLPRTFRDLLGLEWTVFGSAILRDDRDEETGAGKLLLQLADGKTIECVLLKEESRRTVCLSTQVGCAMGCVFCASGLDGVDRNLTAGEMIEELLLLRNLLPCGERLSHIVVMGMGEPTMNLDALLETLAFACSPRGLGISARHVTISTVGLPPRIRQMAAHDKPYHLAVSLHAPNDELRREIVPTAKAIALSDILSAADDYFAATGRQVTFEYVLLADLNDRPAHARELARVLAGRQAFVNLIPYNPVAGLPYGTPPPGRSKEFADILRHAGLHVKIRKRKGAAIDAACGQLRRRQTAELVALA